MVIMAVDPGIRGGIAFMKDSGELLMYCRTPLRRSVLEPSDTRTMMIDMVGVLKMISDFKPTFFFIEKVHAMPQQGLVSTFTFGMGFGMFLGLSTSLDGIMRTRAIPPQTWQKGVFKDMPDKDSFENPKDRAREMAYRIWPHLKEDGVSHDGIIDALLLAEYGRNLIAQEIAMSKKMGIESAGIV